MEFTSPAHYLAQLLSSLQCYFNLLQIYLFVLISHSSGGHSCSILYICITYVYLSFLINSSSSLLYYFTIYCFAINHFFMLAETKAPMMLIWLTDPAPVHPCTLENVILKKHSGFNCHVLMPVETKQPHSTVISCNSFSLSVVCFHTSFFPTLTAVSQDISDALPWKTIIYRHLFFTECICCFTICHLIPYCYYFKLLFVLAKDCSKDCILSGTGSAKHRKTWNYSFSCHTRDFRRTSTNSWSPSHRMLHWGLP